MLISWIALKRISTKLASQEKELERSENELRELENWIEEGRGGAVAEIGEADWIEEFNEASGEKEI